MVLPGLQGTVQCPIGAPNEHTLHTKIMEKSLALFFYCYQSVVHLQSSPSLTPLSELRVRSFPVLFTSICPRLPPCRSHPLSSFSRLWCGVWFTGYKGRMVSFIHQSPVLSALVLPLFYPWAYWAYCASSQHRGYLKNSAVREKGGQNNKNNSAICVGSSFFFFFFNSPGSMNRGSICIFVHLMWWVS